jgi:hypothetical protein
MSFDGVVEGYVSSDDLDALVDVYLLSNAPRSRANVILHVVPSDIEHPALADLDGVARSPLALAADLAEHDSVREKGEAIRSVDDLSAHLAHGNAGAAGVKRG